MTSEIGLVSCVKTKRDSAARPADLYTSSYFEKMREYAEMYHDDWLILSAKHGLLDPDGEKIEPYEETLRNASIDEKREWAKEVFRDLRGRRLLDPEATIVIHAGKPYYEELLPLFEGTGTSVEIAACGLGFGKTLAWYNERLE